KLVPVSLDIELVVRSAGNHRSLELGDRPTVENAPERAGADDVDVGVENLVNSDSRRTELICGAIHRRRVGVGDKQLRTSVMKQFAEAVANVPKTLNGNLETLQVGALQLRLHRGLQADEDAQRGPR